MPAATQGDNLCLYFLRNRFGLKIFIFCVDYDIFKLIIWLVWTTEWIVVKSYFIQWVRDISLKVNHSIYFIFVYLHIFCFNCWLFLYIKIGKIRKVVRDRANEYSWRWAVFAIKFFCKIFDRLMCHWAFFLLSKIWSDKLFLERKYRSILGTSFTFNKLVFLSPVMMKLLFSLPNRSVMWRNSVSNCCI